MDRYCVTQVRPISSPWAFKDENVLQVERDAVEDREMGLKEKSDTLRDRAGAWVLALRCRGPSTRPRKRISRKAREEI